MANAKFNKRVKRKIDPSTINLIDSAIYRDLKESDRRIKKARVPGEGILFFQNTTLLFGTCSLSVIFVVYKGNWEVLSIILKNIF